MNSADPSHDMMLLCDVQFSPSGAIHVGQSDVAVMHSDCAGKEGVGMSMVDVEAGMGMLVLEQLGMT